MPDTPTPATLHKNPSAGAATSSTGADGATVIAERGRTALAVGVVEKIAGMAAREVSGIHALGSGLARTFGAMRDRVPGGRSSIGRGIKAEVGEKQTAIDIALVVEYGVVIPELARQVRENIIDAVERMTGLEVVEVNIAVNDVHLPDEPDVVEEEEEPASSGQRPKLK
ncbi:MULTISPECIES: Asp23/Gls24 family envelope stress response protein [unclassified Streptomyces]|uniref:Asp23/Gls24 family envelope stress response protein n=1 Tax=unclassified Streptomyces TaxID=2593676 RepID=UPI0005F99466|nr:MULTISPECIES: Asp23/Gls24 family envelope stress response protein [unclassified Streptomyces]KJY35460.1 stress protein [Streptomyces sp. NRRL S-495]KOV21175.1 stress protein [Streptomyces sp. XY431]